MISLSDKKFSPLWRLWHIHPALNHDLKATDDSQIFTPLKCFIPCRVLMWHLDSSLEYASWVWKNKMGWVHARAQSKVGIMKSCWTAGGWVTPFSLRIAAIFSSFFAREGTARARKRRDERGRGRTREKQIPQLGDGVNGLDRKKGKAKTRQIPPADDLWSLAASRRPTRGWLRSSNGTRVTPTADMQLRGLSGADKEPDIDKLSGCSGSQLLSSGWNLLKRWARQGISTRNDVGRAHFLWKLCSEIYWSYVRS